MTDKTVPVLPFNTHSYKLRVHKFCLQIFQMAYEHLILLIAVGCIIPTVLIFLIKFNCCKLPLGKNNVGKIDVDENFVRKPEMFN